MQAQPVFGDRDQGTGLQLSADANRCPLEQGGNRGSPQPLLTDSDHGWGSFAGDREQSMEIGVQGDHRPAQRPRQIEDLRVRRLAATDVGDMQGIDPQVG